MLRIPVNTIGAPQEWKSISMHLSSHCTVTWVIAMSTRAIHHLLPAPLQMPTKHQQCSTCHKQAWLPSLVRFAVSLHPAIPRLTQTGFTTTSNHCPIMTPISRKEKHAVPDQISPKPPRHEFRTVSDTSDNTIISSAVSNTTNSRQALFLPHQNATAQTPIQDAEAIIPLRQCINRCSKAITWSMLFSLTLVMEGYSTILVPNLYSLDPFLRQFGTLQRNGDYQISAEWQSALVNGALAGQILGLFLAGWLAEKIGYRRTLLAGLIADTAFISITFFATSKPVLLAGQCLLGAPWGIFQTISTTYAADILPVRLRGYMTTYVHYLT